MHDEQDLAGPINRRGFSEPAPVRWRPRRLSGSAVRPRAQTAPQDDAIGCITQAHARAARASR